jgi:hypothetical protein
MNDYRLKSFGEHRGKVTMAPGTDRLVKVAA